MIAPMIAVRMAPPAPPATNWEMMLPMLKLPDSAAAITEGSARVTIWPSTPPPTKPETMFPTDRTQIEIWRCFADAGATECSGNKVDQNLFHRRSPVELTDPKLSPRPIRAHPRARTKSHPRRQAVGRGDLGVVMSGCPIAAVPSLRQARRRRAAGFQLEQTAG